MTQQKGLKHGLYKIYWAEEQGGGMSLAAIGYTYDGTNWFACCNWTCESNNHPMVASTKWSDVEKIELILEVSYQTGKPYKETKSTLKEENDVLKQKLAELEQKIFTLVQFITKPL